MVDRLKSSATAIAAKWWAPVIGIYASARLLTFLLFIAIAQIQEDNYWTAAKPNYFDFLNIWDAEWYQKIYTNGYPTVLPVGDDLLVQQNNWAFMPVFPNIVKFINSFTGIEWKILAPIIATIFGFAFILVVFKILRERLSRSNALWAIALLSFSTASPILQVGYAESLALLLFAGSLWFLIKREYLKMLPLLAISSITRPGVIAFTLCLLAVFVYRWRRRETETFDRAEQIKLGAVTVASGVLGFAWLIMAALTTGRFDAYLATENAWRIGYTGNSKLMPLEGWFISAGFHLGQGIGQIALLGLIGFTIWLLLRPSVRALGIELQLWSASYLVYLLLVFFPQSSTFRILLPAFPLFGAFAIAIEKWPRMAKLALLALSILSQVIWLLVCWKYTAPDFTPP